MRDLLAGEKGSALIIVTLAMVVLLGFAALAVDGGHLYFRHTRLQDVADATALAAAMEMVETPGNDKKKKEAAFAKAADYAQKNGLTKVADDKKQKMTLTYADGETGVLTISFPDGVKEVKADLQVDTRLYFARVLGYNSTPVAVSATARAGSITEQIGGLVPLCFFWEEEEEEYMANHLYELSLGPGSGESGNYGFLDFGEDYEGNDTKFRDDLMYGYNGSLKVGQQVLSYPGASVGQVNQAIEFRISVCTHGCDYNPMGYDEDGNQVYEVIFAPNCPRVVIIPMISDFFTDIHGRTWLTISGFARFYIIEYEQSTKILRGIFIQKIDSSTGEIGDYSKYLVQTVRLVK